MKSLSTIFTLCLALFALPSCQAIEQATQSSPILDSTTALAESGLDNVYLTLSAKSKGYYAGFRITADGINHPLVVEVDMMSKTTKEWQFDEIISDLFIYENRVSLLLDNGGLFSLINNSWQKRHLTLNQNSRIVFSDGDRNFISCFPSSPMKADSLSGGCESFSPEWKVEFAWREITPKVCTGQLRAVTWSKPVNQLLSIDLETGDIVSRQDYTGQRLCHIE